MALRPKAGQVLLIVDASRSYSETTHWVGLLWMSDRPVADTSPWQHTTLTTNIHAPVAFEPTVSAGERLQTHASDSAATWTGF